ncbi:MAG: hypothetical protein UV63_C0025G0008 [Microgenomates group bacterium GW2011_GWC1_43_11]|uniref:Uncharacterized protein n=2 Tax=Candidatus Gottesmaniibacteriota TaxID=1752720 RepID=A0A0G1KY71_9BACT|nr:MAG: hypothetical protein UV63_C0025G0008 [Microgenomates group bacterium GW2011_GWC1_43_11]KKT37182.1 MAG: hypothetical protein UW22_C0031G0008 [Candidatus Gottesmanbacteria bacterium GW2011_GWB1_44_11c]KKT61287.1 MAG: hypothetical protein UW52_C0006G0008 [Candidatus Gottesmanbacteria bacterium GW2011_GWA1_44_24b]
MKRISFLYLVSLLFTFFFGIPKVFAFAYPTFPTCANPQGTLLVSYPDGTHGIPGSPTSYTGSDAVYRLNDTTLTQCFCSTYGEGIQTNWWNASSLTDDEVAILRSEGWVSIPDGSVWGLDPGPYMAKNSDYLCGGIGGADVLGLGTGGDILGLATTGNIATVYSVFTLAIIFLGVGILIPRNPYYHDQSNR